MEESDNKNNNLNSNAESESDDSSHHISLEISENNNLNEIHQFLQTLSTFFY